MALLDDIKKRYETTTPTSQLQKNLQVARARRGKAVADTGFQPTGEAEQSILERAKTNQQVLQLETDIENQRQAQVGQAQAQQFEQNKQQEALQRQQLRSLC